MKTKIELENNVKYHYEILGFATFKDIMKKFEENFKFYRIANEGKVNAKEIVYDVPNNMLSNFGIVISKQYEDGKIMLKVRKLSSLKGAMKRPSKKFALGELGKDEEPKDFSLQITQAIENSFNTKFTVDLDAFVKETIPKIQIDIEATKYQLICGTGYRAYMLFENITYRDLKTNNKVMRPSVTLQLPNGNDIPENKEILDTIDKKISELALYNYSRFEIAKQLLYPDVKPQEKTQTVEEEE